METKSMIVGSGIAVPSKVLTNKDFEKIVDTSDEWIRERTGMVERRIIEEDRTTSDLCAEAALAALNDANLTSKDLDMIVVASITGDVGFPATACFVQEKIGAVNAAAYDVAAACSGFIYAIDVADSAIALGKARTVLVIGGETLSRVTDYTDRTTCVLFGDGAGAVVMQPSDGKRGVLGTYLKSDGRLSHLLYVSGLGTKNPPSIEGIERGDHFIRMAGREVFKYAVTAMGEAAESVLKKIGFTGDDIDLLIPHQANSRIIYATAKRVNISYERVYANLEKYGNTSAASIPLALHEARQEGRLGSGKIVMLVAFGAGFTWGSAVIRF